MGMLGTQVTQCVPMSCEEVGKQDVRACPHPPPCLERLPENQPATAIDGVSCLHVGPAMTLGYDKLQ